MTSDVAGATPAAPIDAVEFYWRPGCMFCKHLERDLATLIRQGEGQSLELKASIRWDYRNGCVHRELELPIVRSIASGNETVPTVVVGTERFVNPSAREVLDALRRQAPQLDVAADADLDE